MRVLVNEADRHSRCDEIISNIGRLYQEDAAAGGYGPPDAHQVKPLQNVYLRGALAPVSECCAYDKMPAFASTSRTDSTLAELYKLGPRYQFNADDTVSDIACISEVRKALY